MRALLEVGYVCMMSVGPMSINGYCSIVYTLLKVVWCRTGQLLRHMLWNTIKK